MPLGAPSAFGDGRGARLSDRARPQICSAILSRARASTSARIAPPSLTERLKSGNLLFAEEGRGVFLQGRGADGTLFTDDDPLVRALRWLHACGYHALSRSPSADRAQAAVDLMKRSSVQDDLSEQS